MRSPFVKAAAVLALVACSTLAQAQSEAPARVGRVSLVQGPVTISTEDGDRPEAALVNWPVTADNRITTERNARTEIRIGSTAVRLDGGSSLEVLELDDERLALLLHRGRASVRIRNPEVLDGFSIETPQGRVRMREAGSIRIDADRDDSAVDVFDGVALVEADGSSFSVRPGRRVEMRNGDMLTALAVRTSFDDWARLRDLQDDRVTSDRYVTSEMTGYEELDRYGSWSDSGEYGPLWLPRHVPAGWAPYRDGRWSWVAPWGWTWIDNAPWGYAPSHYGRWVMVNQRWGWAPGRHVGHPVWAPALVGWVGGSGWSLSFNSRSAPAQGWYPLGFADQYVPGYRVRHDHLRYINRHARPHDTRRGGDDYRRQGLTVVPHEQFNRRAPIVVPNAPRAVVSPLALQAAPALAPQVPAAGWGDRTRRHRGEQGEPAQAAGLSTAQREWQERRRAEAEEAARRQREPVAAAERGRRQVQPQLQAPAPVQLQAQEQPAGLSSAQREWQEKRRLQAEEARRGELDQVRRAQMDEARRGQAEEARRAEQEQLRRAQAEEARRGQLDQMRRLQMEEMRRGQQDELRRARQAQMQAAPAPQQQQQQQQAAPAPAAAPAQAVNPAVQQERRHREEAQRRGNRPGLNEN